MNEPKGAAPAPVPPKSGGGASSLLEAHAELSKGGSGAGQLGKKRGPYRKNKERESGAAPSAPVVPSAPVPELFTPENTARLVALPFTLAAVSTDYPGWNLDAAESKELSVVGSLTLNQWVSVDPKWVALCLFSLSLVGIATQKAILYQADLKAKGILPKRPSQPPPLPPKPAAPPAAAPFAASPPPNVAAAPAPASNVLDISPGLTAPLVKPPPGFGPPAQPPTPGA